MTQGRPHGTRPPGGALLRIATFGLLLLFAPGGSLAAAQEAPPPSPRNASYEIDVRLDAEARELTGSQVLTWRNLQDQATDELRFHLYWNAWRNDQSTWMREDRLRGRSDRGADIRPDDWSYCQVEAARLLGDAGREDVDLTDGMRFESPDDGNPQDRTVLVVPLPAPVEPGQTVRIAMTWRARVPRTFARTGYRGDYYFLAHWFPKLGVYEAAGWNCHQFHSATEFFSDYGIYDVRMTVPSDYVLGATGREVGREDHGDGTITYRYRQEDVHAFTWTVGRDYVVREQRFDEAGLPPIDMRLLVQREHLGQAERYLAAAAASFRNYGTWYGPYPYGHVTIVDPAYGSGAGGMEYPTLFTGGTRLFAPPRSDQPESVTVHEAGHQFWYGLVGNNEFEDAWIDEGLNTFSTLRTLDTTYPPRELERRYLKPPGGGDGFLPLIFHGIEIPRFPDRVRRYRSSATSDVPSDPTYLQHPKTAGDLTYSKTALWLATLERHLGWETLQPILSTFFERSRFGHPTPDDFLAIAAEVSGEDLSWFFDQVFFDSVAFDYAIGSAASVSVAVRGFDPDEMELAPEEPGGPEERAGPEEKGGPFRTEVVVQRREGGRFPVDVLLTFEDGEEVRERWDGQARWTMITVEHPTKLARAVVDPDRVLLLDRDYTNNSWRREPAARAAAAKWGSKWMIWLQDLLAAFAFFS